MSDGEIITAIATHVRACGGHVSNWYVGVSGNARDRLFSGPGVSETGDSWIYRQAPNSTIARAIEDYFLRQGMDGGPGGGDHTCTYVYAYRKTAYTRE